MKMCCKPLCLTANLYLSLVGHAEGLQMVIWRHHEHCYPLPKCHPNGVVDVTKMSLMSRDLHMDCLDTQHSFGVARVFFSNAAFSLS